MVIQGEGGAAGGNEGRGEPRQGGGQGRHPPVPAAGRQAADEGRVVFESLAVASTRRPANNDKTET